MPTGWFSRRRAEGLRRSRRLAEPAAVQELMIAAGGRPFS
jgi:hypothetical protein